MKIQNSHTYRQAGKFNIRNFGFTLIEMLLVLALIALLAALVVVAINPGKQLSDARNSVRVANIHTIIDAIYQYSIDHHGAFPATITSTPTEICKTEAHSCTGLIDLSVLTTHKVYLVDVPIDPLVTQGNGTGYLISISDNRISASSIYAERNEVINIVR